MASFLQRLPGSQQDRKLRKPLIERKRRERINNCLDKLKETVVGAFHLDQSKLEKADILEMTVQHLQNIQGNKMADSIEVAEDQQKYSTGYIQCVHEVHNLLLTCEWMDKTLGARMLNHLLKSLPKSSEEAAQDPTPVHVPPAPVLVPPAPQDCRSASLGDPVDARAPQGLPFSPKGSKSAGDPSPPYTPGSPQPPMSSHCSARMGALDMWRPW